MTAGPALYHHFSPDLRGFILKPLHFSFYPSRDVRSVRTVKVTYFFIFYVDLVPDLIKTQLSRRFFIMPVPGYIPAAMASGDVLVIILANHAAVNADGFLGFAAYNPYSIVDGSALRANAAHYAYTALATVSRIP